MRYTWLILIFLIGFASPVKADQTRSDFWLEICEDNTDPCEMYLQGISSTLMMMNSLLKSIQKSAIKHNIAAAEAEKDAEILEYTLEYNRLAEQNIVGCFNHGVTTTQMVKVWMLYLKNNPAEHHQLPIITLSQAMTKAFPCSR
jgi:hypothetical protein